MLISLEEIRALAARFGTPLYLLDAERVVEAMRGLRCALIQHYPNSEITYSVKTNYLAGILRSVLANGYRLEVVSRHELTFAEAQGAGPKQLLFNGPVKSLQDLQYCYRRGIDVNVDSLDELAVAAEIGPTNQPFSVGLRVAATLASGKPSRFGIDFDEPGNLDQVRRLMAERRIRIAGLHLHHSSRRDAHSYCERMDRLHEVAQMLGIEPEYLDLGGGMASIPPPEIAARLAYPIDSHQRLASVVGRHALAKFGASGPRIILEPGIGVLAGAMNYVTSVVALKSSGAVCDGSMFDVNPLRSSLTPPCHLVPLNGLTTQGPETELYGGTCMEIDRLGTLPRPPRVGDLVVVTNVGAYSTSLAPEFIVPAAPVYALDSQTLVRHRQALGQFHRAGQ